MVLLFDDDFVFAFTAFSTLVTTAPEADINYGPVGNGELMPWVLLVQCSDGITRTVHNISTNMTYEAFCRAVYASIGPFKYKLYLVSESDSNGRRKLTAEGFAKQLSQLYESSSGLFVAPLSILYAHFSLEGESPVGKLTLRKLQLHNSINESKKTNLTIPMGEDEASSVGSCDSCDSGQNIEVLTRDSNQCVVCRRSGADVNLQVAHLFDVEEYRSLSKGVDDIDDENKH